MKVVYLILSAFVIQFSLFSQKVEDPLQLAKNLYKEKKFQEAETEILRRSEVQFSNPEYDLLQSKIWIELGNQNYIQRKFSTAYKYYSKAYEFWSADPLVQQRYYELKNKDLVDEVEILEVKKTKIPVALPTKKENPSNDEPLFKNELIQLNFKIQESELSLSSKIESINEKIMFLIIGNIVFMNLLLISIGVVVFLYLKLKK
ncbi:hypothetical protein LPTSP2_36550 [Leptospira ellinghausenii]|uniref:Tetratricopeptide repeat protein n=1 Tax=Leptospira ellinghausenii TaxID=1917822 RepID=A0A2P2DI81_9LEPT|nr:hypothetical protein [Leptospira ellinghausenii]GBF44352.1 hypothetical protein LPTSP2_36550 [Leptospira ellinghausenii]